ncbi:type II and III secretion system protein family protein [Basilea psittacipulmonis]|uniref:Uncharacterized protein n=1 Tax=Basilea psittacipulmonis DSM 24701 TaxID=1072685 RepID=A0A077DCN2_9BURK|nr:pilus assembly protein N-terminal domain-containing protein [Basilea psittacipulmonis]AIL32359.1 hypothetical protein IX83_02640 [Basilea psittacipulmonis DSM 24701]
MFLSNRFLKVFSVVTLATVASVVQAAAYRLEMGGSHVVNTNKDIDTVFVSNSTIADYEVVGDRKLVVYAKAEGTSQVTTIGADGEVITDDQFIVVGNALGYLSDTNRQIRARFPNTSLVVRKIGQAYIIEGKAKTWAESKQVEHIVGEALGLESEVIQKGFETDLPNSGSGRFLDEYRYKGLINNAIVDEPSQINVKMTIVDVSKKFKDQLGIDWFARDGSLNRGIGFGANMSGSGTNFSGSITPGSYGLGLFNSKHISAFFNALNDDTKGRILSEPNISVLSGETAEILIGGEYPYTTASSTSGVANTTEYKEYGIKLKIGAKIDSHDKIRLMMYQDVSEIQVEPSLNSSGDSIARLVTNRSRSTIELKDGESFVIGGLYSKKDSESLKKFPLLGDLPIIGAFFRSASTHTEDRELIIVATVNLVRPTVSPEQYYPEYDDRSIYEVFFNTTPIKNSVWRSRATKFIQKGGFIQ